MQLIEPISGLGRNITVDSYFSSFPLANNVSKFLVLAKKTEEKSHLCLMNIVIQQFAWI